MTTGYPAIPSPAPPQAAHSGTPALLAIRGRGFGAETEPTPAADATAWVLLCLLAFCLSWILVTAILVKRRLRRQDPASDFRSEIKTHCKSADCRSPWQKPEDWWKR